jgi:hypothetical protein
MQDVSGVTLYRWASVPDISKDRSDPIFRVNHCKQSRAAIPLGLLDPEDEDTLSFETSVTTRPTTQRNIPKDLLLHERHSHSIKMQGNEK